MNIVQRIATFMIALVLGSSIAAQSPALARGGYSDDSRPGNVVVVRQQPGPVVVVSDNGPSRSGRLARDSRDGRIAKRDDRDPRPSVGWKWVNKYDKSEGIYLFVPYLHDGFSYDLREKKRLYKTSDLFGPDIYSIKANGTGVNFRLLDNGTVSKGYPNYDY